MRRLFARLSLFGFAWCALLGTCSAAANATSVSWMIPDATAPAATRSADSGLVSLSDYQAKLQSLDRLLATCQKAINSDNCQSQRVGDDIRLALPSGPRLVRFAWLRELLDRAAGEDSGKNPGKQNPSKQNPVKQNTQQSPSPAAAKVQPATPDAKTRKAADAKASEDSQDSDDDELIPLKILPQFEQPSLAQQLASGRKRLSDEAAVVAQLEAPSQPSMELATPPARQDAHPKPSASSGESSERQALARILAAKEYHAAVAGPTIVDRFFEKLGNWIDRFFGKLTEAGFKSKWIGYSAEIGFVLLLCIALVWFLIRIEKQGRLGLAGPGFGSGSDAASARDWQLWLGDARSAAAKGAWREGIHLLYWACISRLESSGQWPADRARTPREYLTLLSPDNAQRAELTRLTQSFERTWYAGRPAQEADFRAAEHVASKLGVLAGGQ